MNPHTAGILYAIATALLWGVLAIVLKVSTGFLSVKGIVFFRFLLAFLILFFILAWKRRDYLTILKHPPLLGIVAALSLAANYFGYNKGLHLSAPGFTQIIIQLAPVMFAVSGVFYFKERLSRRQLFGFVVTAFGFSLFYQQKMQSLAALSHISDQYVQGALWIIFSAVAWAIYAIAQKLLVQADWPPQKVNLLIYGLSAVVFLPTVDTSEFAQLDADQWTIMIFLGVNTLLAYGALGEAVKRIPANQVSIIIVMNPLLTLALMALLAHLQVSFIAPEPIALWGYAGAVLVVFGVCMVVTRPFHK